MQIEVKNTDFFAVVIWMIQCTLLEPNFDQESNFASELSFELGKVVISWINNFSKKCFWRVSIPRPRAYESRAQRWISFLRGQFEWSHVLFNDRNSTRNPNLPSELSFELGNVVISSKNRYFGVIWSEIWRFWWYCESGKLDLAAKV